jgi:autotransporter-associated beta strand protein
VFDSDTNTITINKPLNHYTSGAATDGGLVKLGTGALTFSGVTNTYNGMTTVSNGTLVVSNMSALSAGHVTVVNTATVSLNSARSGGAITDSKNLYVNGGATVLIESNVNEVVYEFYIDGVIQNPGVWGRVGGGAAHESARIAGDGTLTVNHNPIPFVWNVTNGVWDTFTTNWLAGGTPSVWGGGLSDAIFTNGTSSRVVSVTNTQSAGSIRIGNNSNNCASYAFVNTSGSSLSASSVLIQGIYGAGPEGLTSFTNFNLTCAGDVGVGRRTLMIIGNSVMNVSRLVSSDFIGTSVGDCQWGSFTIQGNASVTASNGVALTSVNNLRLDGGLLSVPAVKVCDQNIAARMTFNGGRLVALVSTNDFLQLSSGVDSSFLPYGAYIAVGGAWIDTGTNTVTITKPLKHEGVPIDGGLIKLGAGLLTMTATNSYNGMTTVSNGTLRLAAFDNGVSSNGSVAVASGAFLDLAGFNQTVSNLMGGGSITNLAGGKTLTITGTNTFTGTILGGGTTVVSGVMSPAGPGFIGQMTMNNTLILSGTLQVDVATNGTSASDLLVTQGTLDLTGAKLSVVNTNNLDVDKRYVVLTYSNAPTGAFNDSLLPLHWITQNDAVNNRILLRRESSGSLLMIQ